MSPHLEFLTTRVVTGALGFSHKEEVWVELPGTSHKTNDLSTEESKTAHTLVMLNHLAHEKKYREEGDEKGPQCDIDIDTAYGDKLNLADAARISHEEGVLLTDDVD